MNARARVLPTLLLFFLFATAAACQTSPSPAAYPSQGALAERIHSIVSAPAVSRAHWGVAVTTVDGAPIFGMNEGQFFRPASNAKLFTTAAAMALLHPDATVSTRIYGKLNLASGTVDGDLMLVGGGDANFDTTDIPYVSPSRRPKLPPPAVPFADMRTLVDQLVARGVKRIKGNVVGDDTLFVYEPVPPTWGSDDLTWGYGAPVSALSVADNALRLTVRPGTWTETTPGRAITKPDDATLEQNGVDYYAVHNDVGNARAGLGAHVDVERIAGSRVVHVTGFMAPDAAPDTEQIAIDEPALYAARALKMLLVASGIKVGGDATARHLPAPPSESTLAPLAPNEWEGLHSLPHMVLSCTPAPPPGSLLAEHVSAHLSDDVLFTNKVSQNLHAELLLHRIGLLDSCKRGSTASGAHFVRLFLEHAGLNGDDFLFYDGSGLSSHDLVTPRATAKLLSYASTQPWFAQWKASLPVGGEDGTLRARFGEKSPLKDHIFAKTGTLGESRALSGYLDAASGKTVIFSILVDTHTPTSSADREAMDAVVEAIAAAN